MRSAGNTTIDSAGGDGQGSHDSVGRRAREDRDHQPGTMLAQYGKKTFIMDADIGMANVGLLIGLDNVPVTSTKSLQERPLSEAIYDGPGGLKVIPSGISPGVPGSQPQRLRTLKDIVDR